MQSVQCRFLDPSPRPRPRPRPPPLIVSRGLSACAMFLKDLRRPARAATLDL
jgi:hypothetical protein